MHSGSGKRVYLDIKVHPRSSKKMMQKTGEREYKVWVVSAPEGGKANKEVVDLVASHFHIPPSWVRIAKGEKSRQKIVVLEYG